MRLYNRAHVLQGGNLLDEKKSLNPNDDVNKSQSSNDTFPTAMHIAAYKIMLWMYHSRNWKLRDTLDQKAKENYRIVKLEDAFNGCDSTHAWQEFSGYVSQLDHGLHAIRFHSIIFPNWHWEELLLEPASIHPRLCCKCCQTHCSVNRMPFVTAENKFEAGCSRCRRCRSWHFKTVAVGLMKPPTTSVFARPTLRNRWNFIPGQWTRFVNYAGKSKSHQCEAMTMVAVQVMGTMFYKHWGLQHVILNSMSLNHLWSLIFTFCKTDWRCLCFLLMINVLHKFVTILKTLRKSG